MAGVLADLFFAIRRKIVFDRCKGHDAGSFREPVYLQLYILLWTTISLKLWINFHKLTVSAAFTKRREEFSTMLSASGAKWEWSLTLDWISNRGGLTRISDEAFCCFCDIEIHIHKYLREEDTRDINKQFTWKVQDSVLSSDDLLFDWCIAIEFTTDQEIADTAYRCLEKIVQK